MTHAISHYKFEVDFSPVERAPEDPRDRLPYFNSFKELVRREKEKIKLWHRGGAGGREVIQAHTGFIDEVIRHIITSLALNKEYARFNVINEFCLIAVGGYGRGELNPFSDIDLLFLKPNRMLKKADRFIQDVTSILWGMGLEIGQACRTVKDCVRLAEEDLTVRTSMSETRFLIGDRDKYEKFCASIHKSILRKNVQGFLQAKILARRKRIGGDEGVASNPEPNIKEGSGGLRDYHAALWAVTARFGSASLREVGRDDIVSDRELDQLDTSLNFILRVRNELHYLKGKKFDVLDLEIQQMLAANLGYRGPSPVQATERFMRDYFLHATAVRDICGAVFERCLTPERSIRRVISSFTRKSLGNGFNTVD
ncbi:MAG: hypothetical protein COV67_11995, partial [Nitrospinae bacterium CG11_big_fil_rev_8_21_14_0_20_56_8]